MRVGFKNIQRFQEGGAMPPQDPGMEGGAPMPPEAGAPEGAPQGGGEDPMMQIAQMAMQALQSQDCNAAMQVCEAFVQLIQQAQGGGAPEGAAPPPEEAAPVFRKGGKFIGYVRK